MMRILITGAHSYVGCSLEHWLMRFPALYEVDTVSTRNNLWEKVDFSQYEVIFHVAGIAHIKETKSNYDLYFKVNSDLTLLIANRAKKNKVKQFIFMSSMSVYNVNKSLKPIVITKETEPRPMSSYGKSKLDAEKKLGKLNDSSFKIVILRPPMIYGPNCKGNFPRLVKLSNLIPIFPNFHNERSMLYIDNLCSCIENIINANSSGIFFPQNKQYMDITEMVKSLANIQNHKIYFLKILIPFLYLFSPFIKTINKIFGTLIYDKDLSFFASEEYSINKSLIVSLE